VRVRAGWVSVGGGGAGEWGGGGGECVGGGWVSGCWVGVSWGESVGCIGGRGVGIGASRDGE